METIGEKSEFHGYIIGLQLERTPDEKIGNKMYALFEYNGEVKLKQIPDFHLFKLLSDHLVEMATLRENCPDDYGYNKLWIAKKNGKWSANLP